MVRYAARNRTWISAVDLTSGSEKTILEDAAQPAILPTGDLLFLRDNSLYMVGFDAAALGARAANRVWWCPAFSSTPAARSGRSPTGGSRLGYIGRAWHRHRERERRRVAGRRR